MYIKLTRNGVNQFVDLMESYRVRTGPDAGKVRQHHLFRFGELNPGTMRKLSGLADSLARFRSGRDSYGDRATTRSAPGRESKKTKPHQTALRASPRDAAAGEIQAHVRPLRKIRGRRRMVRA